jgi:hypothetical protein
VPHASHFRSTTGSWGVSFSRKLDSVGSEP